MIRTFINVMYWFGVKIDFLGLYFCKCIIIKIKIQIKRKYILRNIGVFIDEGWFL